MTFNINTNCFTLGGNEGSREMIMTDEFTELADVLKIVLNKWNEVQTRREAVLSSTPESALMLKAMAETVIAVCDKAIENGKEKSI